MKVIFYKNSRYMAKFRSLSIILLIFLLECKTYYKELKVFPENLKQVFIENFSNQTFEPYIHLELTDVLKQKFHTRNTLILTKEPDNTKYILKGKVILFRREVLLYTNELEPTHYKIDMVVEIYINKKNQTLLKEEVYDSIRYSLKEGAIENDFQARRRLYERISQKILYHLEKTILEDLKGTIDENSRDNTTR
ncbi:MAG: hypothetical protein KatS3mg129_2900 [Leptospiraceae bacterium]|nr:MAG: hypothetical protein KatS3mg129_2900 [Leptospiraceae bacterium]